MKSVNGKQWIQALMYEFESSHSQGNFKRKASEMHDLPQFEDLMKIKDSLQAYEADFDPAFDQKLMFRIRQLRQMGQKQQRLFQTMLRYSMGVAAAAFLLLAFIIWQENSLAIDGLLGLAGLKSDDFTNLLAIY